MEALLADRLAPAFAAAAGEPLDPVVRRSEYADYQSDTALAHARRLGMKEILIGFTIAGFISVFVPQTVWNALFPEAGSDTPSLLAVIENAAIAPLVAFFTFCGCELIWRPGASRRGASPPLADTNEREGRPRS